MLSKFKIFVITVVSVSLLGIGINAFAHRGMGWGGGGGYHGQGWHHRDGYEPGYGGPMGELSKEILSQIEEKREAFLKDTREIRAELIEKKRLLQAEMTKEEVDVAKASELQKALSELQGQFDQKRIEHMAEMRKVNPNAGRGYKRLGPKNGYGRMMGPRGKGYCWE